MTLTLISLNVILLCVEQVLLEIDVSRLEYLLQFYGTVPVLVWAREGGGAFSSLTSTFLHAGLWHLGSNMLALWVFGRRVEDACGSWRFSCLLPCLWSDRRHFEYIGSIWQ